MGRDAQLDLDAGAGYAEQIRTLRSAAKWLLASAAGVGAVMVGGLQLSGISRLPLSSWRLYVAAGALSVALGAIGYVIRIASTLLTQEWLTLASFTDEQAGIPTPWRTSGPRYDPRSLILERLEASRHELYGHVAPTLAELHRALRESNELIWRPGLDPEARREASARADRVRTAAGKVVQAANYYHLLHHFERFRVRVAWAAAIVALGVIVFSYVIGTPDP